MFRRSLLFLGNTFNLVRIYRGSLLRTNHLGNHPEGTLDLTQVLPMPSVVEDRWSKGKGIRTYHVLATQRHHYASGQGTLKHSCPGSGQL